MKLEINIDSEISETLVKVFANSINDDVKAIQRLSENFQSSCLPLFNDGECIISDFKDILRVYTDEKNVYVKTEKGIFKIKMRIYELEEKLPKKFFIKISQGEILNASQIRKLDLTYKGTIAVELKNGDTVFVSRRCLKTFKTYFNI